MEDTNVSIFEQDLHGNTQYRVMNKKHDRIFGVNMLDFPTYDEALQAIRGEYRRKGLTGTVSVHRMDEHRFTNRTPAEVIHIPLWTPEGNQA